METRIALIDEILQGFCDVIGPDFDAYRNHVYRVTHLCLAQRALVADDRQKVCIAAAFHDIGIWTAHTLDYLPPSEEQAERYLRATGRDAWVSEVVEMIEMHHGLHALEQPHQALAETFRRADIADFSLGMFPMGIPRPVIAQLKRLFPNAGFHKRLLQLGTVWFLRHPFNPLPMFRR